MPRHTWEGFTCSFSNLDKRIPSFADGLWRFPEGRAACHRGRLKPSSSPINHKPPNNRMDERLFDSNDPWFSKMRRNMMIHHLVISSADWFHLLSVCTCASIRGNRTNHTGDTIPGRVWQARVQMSVVFISYYFILQLFVQYFIISTFRRLVLLLDHLYLYRIVLFPCWPLLTGSLLSSEQISRSCTLSVWLNL